MEATEKGMGIYENPVKVLTNNPPFPFQMMNLCQYRGLSSRQIPCDFADEVELEEYSRGMGALGLPGDLSSASRFVRAAFHRLNAESGETEEECVHQFFHLLGSVEMPRGSLILENGALDLTVYSSCCNTDRGIYYYKTYENSHVIGVDMYKEDLEGNIVISYPFIKEKLYIQN